MLVVNVLTDQILRANVLMDQTHLVINVLTDQIHRVRDVRTDQILRANVLTDQILLVDVLIYVTLNFVLFVMPFLANV